ncbi:unnamed protein product [Caenorhabditis angaria]|uniref:SSD domain-containing protein n=1 Tax=Caenorhabditis angaria TaxID=860376 RepID=A0A9P1I798_9PELO|nr:unnamed protein product [Caenorhabditis angaria]
MLKNAFLTSKDQFTKKSAVAPSPAPPPPTASSASSSAPPPHLALSKTQSMEVGGVGGVQVVQPQLSSSLPGGGGTSLAQRPRRQSLLIGQRSLDVYNEVDQGPKFVRWIIEKFRSWGFLIAKHAWIAIVICLIVSALSVLKIVTTKQKNDITGYSPYGARALTEYTEYSRFFSSEGLAVAAYLFIIAKDNGSMTRPDYLEETIQVLNFAMNNITMFDATSNKNETFNQFCQNFCQINEPVRQFYNGYKILNDGGDNSRIKMNYPISEMFGRQFSLQPNFFGVETFENSDQAAKILAGNDDENLDVAAETSNSTAEPMAVSKITNVKSVKMITLQFRAEHKAGWKDEEIKKWEMQLVEIFEKNYNSKRLKIYSYSQTYVEEEMVRGGIIMIPYLVVGFSIMCVCSCILVMTRALYMHQENFYKIILAIMACLTPLLACSTALAVMFLCGIRFASILCVIPFLVLSIGVDSSYLMIHEWQRVTKHMRETPRKKDSVGHRMSEVMAEVGPAILISCLTNMFADFVGAFTSSPEITLLCAGNMLSMWFAFIYQMTFYAGLMSIVGKFEFGTDEVDKNRMEINIAENRVNIARHHRPLTRQPSKFHEATQPIISESLQKYTHLMTTPLVFVGICVLYIAYLAFSIYGITQVNINLTAQKLFALDSPLLELDDLRVQYQVPHFSMATVFVNNPGNLEDPQRLMRLNKFIREMEALNGSWGKSWGEVGTKYFCRDYDVFQQSFGSEDEEEEEEDFESEKEVTVHSDDKMTYREDELKYFLNWPEYDFWQGFVKTKNATNTTDPDAQVLDKFFFTTGYHGQNLSVWTQRGLMLKKWRSVVDEYKDFGASVFHEDGIYLDLIDNMPFDTMQSVLGTLVCMAFVCFVFLNNLFTVAIASMSVLSICAGILGILSWWGVDLDPITMAAMIISIGFSVDIPAHVSYHYYQASIQEGPMSPPSSRLANCLSSVAFPALQAAVSTILCVCSLLFVNLYMAEVFVKTMVLCVVLCNLHGLVFLPAILILLDSIRWACRPKGAAAQRPKPAQKSGGSRQKAKNSKIQPEKSSVTDRPEV